MNVCCNLNTEQRAAESHGSHPQIICTFLNNDCAKEAQGCSVSCAVEITYVIKMCGLAAHSPTEARLHLLA